MGLLSQLWIQPFIFISSREGNFNYYKSITAFPKNVYASFCAKKERGESRRDAGGKKRDRREGGRRSNVPD